MTEPRPPFYVSFSHDRVPQAVDHSRANPGPPGGAANRAGHTSIRPKGRLSFAWDQSPVGPDGRIPIFAQSINVYFWLTDFAVAISSDFTERSCAYQTTLRHEFQAAYLRTDPDFPFLSGHSDSEAQRHRGADPDGAVPRRHHRRSQCATGPDRSAGDRGRPAGADRPHPRSPGGPRRSRRRAPLSPRLPAMHRRGMGERPVRRRGASALREQPRPIGCSRPRPVAPRSDLEECPVCASGRARWRILPGPASGGSLGDEDMSGPDSNADEGPPPSRRSRPPPCTGGSRSFRCAASACRMISGIAGAGPYPGDRRLCRARRDERTLPRRRDAPGVDPAP